MRKNDNDDMNKPVLKNQNILESVFSSPAFENFGQVIGDKILVSRENGNMASVKRNKNNTVLKSQTDGQKNSTTLYDTGSAVSTNSTKKHKKK